MKRGFTGDDAAGAERGDDEAPSEALPYPGQSYKSYRGIASIGAMA